MTKPVGRPAAVRAPRPENTGEETRGELNEGMDEWETPFPGSRVMALCLWPQAKEMKSHTEPQR